MDDANAIEVGGFSKDDLARIGPAMQDVVDQGVLSGAVNLIWRRGQTALVTANGWQDVEHKLPMRRDTIFRIASMSKPITSVATMMLMEDGKLRLNDPITKWAPEFANMKVLKDPDGPIDETYPAPRDITIEDLLTHRAGLAYGFGSQGPIAKAYEQVLNYPANNDQTPDQFMAALASLPLIYAPGERFHYSHATDVLGFLVARIAGMDLSEVLKARILQPLGMVDTDFWTPPEKRDRLATVYALDGEPPHLKAAKFKPYEAPPILESGGGGLVSTGDDYLAFARLFVSGGEVDGVRLLKPESVKLMMTNRLTEAQRQNTFMGIPMWRGQGFGLGLSVILDAEENAWSGPGTDGAVGWPGAYGTWWRADPAEDMVMIHLIQSSLAPSPGASDELMASRRLAAQAGLSPFLRLTYEALGREV